VGIGTSSPSNLLHINKASGNTEFRSQSSAGSCYVVNRPATSAMDLLNSMNGPITLATNNAERVRIDANGYVTMPYQPCFLAYRTATQTGTSPFTILFDTVPVNVGSGYNSGTGRFTAPVTGNYHFAFQSLGIVTSWSSFDIFSWKNGGSTPSILSSRPTSTSGGDNASALSTAVGICNLTAGDYIEIKAAGTTQIYSDGNAWLKFMGFLIG
jgi:hypothetical protein